MKNKDNEGYYKDDITCNNCGKQSLVEMGDNTCPNCGAYGTLKWTNEDKPEVLIN